MATLVNTESTESTGSSATIEKLGTAAGPATPRSFRPDIQGLRAIAVGLVVLYHANVPGIPGGYVGVDVFFVISGFLITRQLTNEALRSGRISLFKFYSRRMRRLLPPAVVVVIVTMLVARAVLPYSQVVSLIHDVWYTAVYGINYHLAIEGINYQQASAPPSPLQHFWSLSVEEQFYFIWPVLIVACLLLGRRRFRPAVLITAIAAICVVTFYFSVTITSTNTPMAYFSIHTRAWELGLGALVALVNGRLARVPARLAAALSWTGLAMLLAGAFLYSDTTPYPGSAALLPVAGAALIIAGGSLRHTGSPETVFLDRSMMQYVGKVSYAWYLWHWPLLILLPAWAGKEFTWMTNVEVVVIAFWLAVLTYFLENACLRSHWSIGRWFGVGVGLAATSAVIALLASVSLPSVVGSGVARSVTSLAVADATAVQNALTDGMKITALPRNLTPTLDNVTTDLPQSTKDGCHAALLQTAPVTCTYGDPNGTRTAVLLGDSHAQQWLAALIPNARAQHWKLITYTKAACPIATLTVWNNDLKRLYAECDTWRIAAFANIKALDPDMIIGSESDSVPWSAVSDARWADETVRSLQRIAGPKTHIVFIGDTPQTTADPTPCLQQHLTNAQACAYQRSAAYLDFPDRKKIMHSELTAAGMGYVDPLNFFCGLWCPAVVGNMVVRRDTGHITNTYAAWLAPMLTPIFKDVSK